MHKAEIIILAGQSNAVGVGHTKYLKDHFDAPIIKKFYNGYDSVLINYYSHAKKSDGFVPVTVNCTEVAKDTLGPEVGIAKYLFDHYPDRKFYIVKFAVGGVNLNYDWLSQSSGAPYSNNASVNEVPNLLESLAKGQRPSAGWCYNGLKDLLHQSIDLLEKQGLDPKIKAFFWMQGESDACEKQHVIEYIRRYDNLLSDLNLEFKDYFDNCVYVDAGISNTWQFYDQMNKQKAAYAKDKGYKFIDTIANGLTTTREPIECPDVAHYDCDSTVKLGELFAKYSGL